LILRTLQTVGWVIGGPKGAAARLGLKRPTLIHRMKKLGISRPHLDGEGLLDPPQDGAGTAAAVVASADHFMLPANADASSSPSEAESHARNARIRGGCVIRPASFRTEAARNRRKMAASSRHRRASSLPLDDPFGEEHQCH
jgi:hypothetical protein